MKTNLYCFHCMHPLQTPGETCPHCGFDNRQRTNGAGNLADNIIDGRYLVGRRLGRGSFSVTYIGYDLKMKRICAVKEFFPSKEYFFSIGHSTEDGVSVIFNSDMDCRRYRQGMDYAQREAIEARKASENVPGLVRIYDILPANNTFYIIMEYVEGDTLTQLVHKRGMLNMENEVLPMFLLLMEALQQLHTLGYIHQGINPDNIIVRQSTGKAVLLDYGGAWSMEPFKYEENDDPPLDLLLKKREFFPPEATLGGSVPLDERSDQYALCATIYFAITGEKPLSAADRLLRGGYTAAVEARRGYLAYPGSGADEGHVTHNEKALCLHG